MTLLQRAFRGLPVYELKLPDDTSDFRINLTDSPLPGHEWHVFKQRWRSLNPSPTQLMQIKCTYLERRFKRTKVTPAQLFYGKPADALYKWLNDNSRLSVYLRAARYRNNYEI